jgi:hypothetical protein
MGHEIGIHNDLISDYLIKGKDPKENLTELLKVFEGEGITISGSASHGSSFVQKLNNNLDKNAFITYRNYLVFSELLNKALLNSPERRQPPHPKFNRRELSLPCLSMNHILSTLIIMFLIQLEDFGQPVMIQLIL